MPIAKRDLSRWHRHTPNVISGTRHHYRPCRPNFFCIKLSQASREYWGTTRGNRRRPAGILPRAPRRGYHRSPRVTLTSRLRSLGAVRRKIRPVALTSTSISRAVKRNLHNFEWLSTPARQKRRVIPRHLSFDKGNQRLIGEIGSWPLAQRRRTSRINRSASSHRSVMSSPSRPVMA